MHFGSWTIELGRRHHRSLLQWDGKEFLMSLSQCNVADSQAPRDWKIVVEEPVGDHSTAGEVFGAAENLILENVRT